LYNAIVTRGGISQLANSSRRVDRDLRQRAGFSFEPPVPLPLDQIHVELIRRTFLYDDATLIDYNPLTANPDYLVVGPHSKQWRLYDDVLKTGAFRGGSSRLNLPPH
jgi:hypothetical protein